MAQKEQGGRNRARGFASMDEEKKRQVASQGGLASARGKNTSNRGFASMDKDKQKEISSMGGRASRSGGPREKHDRTSDQNDINGEKDTSVRDLTSPDTPDLTASSRGTQVDLASSETDEDEDEGLGDGNLGRSTGDVFGK